MNRRTLCLFALLPALAACASLNRDPAAEPVRVVFFNEDSDTLEAPARRVVQEAAEAAARFAPVRVNVFGYAGPVGGAAFNRALSEARAQHVAELLRQSGVPADRVFVLGRGEVPFAMAPIESRRVEIRLAPP
jgi:outer membrane protein OmpA-like peptidoglycan-associated protein